MFTRYLHILLFLKCIHFSHLHCKDATNHIRQLYCKYYSISIVSDVSNCIVEQVLEVMKLIILALYLV